MDAASIRILFELLIELLRIHIPCPGFLFEYRPVHGPCVASVPVDVVCCRLPVLELSFVFILIVCPV